MKYPQGLFAQFFRSGRRIPGLVVLGLVGLIGLAPSARAQLYSQNFSGGTAPGWTTAAGTWSVVTGTPSYYTDSTLTAGPDVAYYSTLALPDTGFSYSSSVRLYGTGPANCVGVVYYYQSTLNYYEVELNPNSPTGTVQLYEHINSAAGTLAASGAFTSNGGGNYQTVLVSRSGSTTTIKVNGTTILTRTQTALTGGGKIGATDRWASNRITSIVVSDTQAPTVSITSPADNATVSGTTTVSASASDNVAVASVQFQLDGTNLGSAITTAPYNYTWNTTTASNASHVLTAIATDTSSNQTTSAGSFVTVSNGGGGGGGALGGSYFINFNNNTAPSWSVPTGSGTWTASGGTYNITAYNTTTGKSIALYTGQTWNTDYVIRAAVKSGFGGSGNYGGIIFNYADASDYYTLIFDIQGYAELDKCVSGTVSTIATAATGTFGGGHLSTSTWEDVDIRVTGTTATVRIQGALVFNNVSLSGSALQAGEMGCYTQWDTGSFDNFSVTQIPSTAYTDGFATGSTTGWSGTQGTWSASSPYYVETAYNTATGESTAIYGTSTWNTNYTYSASVYTLWNAPANDVGVIFNYVDANNYYDVLVSATGVVELDKKISGTLTVVQTTAAGAYPGYGSKQWVDICVLRQANGNVSVNVNGMGIFSNVALTTLGAGNIGLKATWNSTGKYQFLTVSNGLVPYKRVMPKLAQVFNGGNRRYDSYESTIAAYDMTVLGIYNGWHKSGGITQAQLTAAVHAINPATLIVNYTVVEFEVDTTTNVADDDHDVISYLYAQTGPTGNGGTWTPNDWWARDDTGVAHNADGGSGAGFLNTNVTYFVTPDANGLRFPQWYANREDSALFSGTGYDGWFSDNNFGAPLGIADWDRNGTTDSDTDATVGTYYRQGLADYLEKINQLEPGVLCFPNSLGVSLPTTTISPEYSNFAPCTVFEGAMGESFSFETWSVPGWANSQEVYQTYMDNTVAPNLVWFNVDGDATGHAWYAASNYSGGASYAFMRYGLCSAMLENGYYAYAVNQLVGGSVDKYDVSLTQWFDEYSVILGEPIQPPARTSWSKGVYERLYQNGLVLVNPRTNGSQTVNVTTLGSGLFKHFSGTQDSTTNNGANVTTVTLGDGDGLVLINQ